MNILITGGLGCIGTHLINAIRNTIGKECNITIIDIADRNFFGSTLRLDENISIYITSILNTQKLETIFATAQPNIVIHLAGLHFVPWCNTNPNKTFDVNTYATIMLYELAEKFKVDQFIFASSAAIYGNKKEPCEENFTPSPINIYGKSKYLAEQALFSFKKVPYTILRFFNIYGPYSLVNHIIPTIINQLLQHPKRIYLESLNTVRDYIHISDVVSSILSVVLNTNSFWDIYNVGTGVPTSILELVSIFENILDKKLEIIHSTNKSRKIDIPFLCAENKKIKHTLNWFPSIKLENGIKQLMAFS